MSRRVNLGVQKGLPALRFLQKGADSGVSPLKNGKGAGSLRFRLQESAQAYTKCEWWCAASAPKISARDFDDDHGVVGAVRLVRVDPERVP